jgi:protein-tyrosine-phosphatase
VKNKADQFSNKTQRVVFGALGFEQSAFSRKIKERHFTRIDIIIALFSQFFSSC